jgi:nitric oxide reductase large subunit
MFRSKIIISVTIFITFLVLTSAIKNKTRIIEKQIIHLNNKILLQKKDFNEAQLEFYYITSPAEIEKKLSLIGFSNYQPIKYSNIFFKISDFDNIQNKFSNLKNLNEKKIK